MSVCVRNLRTDFSVSLLLLNKGFNFSSDNEKELHYFSFFVHPKRPFSSSPSVFNYPRYSCIIRRAKLVHGASSQIVFLLFLLLFLSVKYGFQQIRALVVGRCIVLRGFLTNLAHLVLNFQRNCPGRFK